jgi:pimeloyl-ACP methyl ester carboxylesterase
MLTNVVLAISSLVLPGDTGRTRSGLWYQVSGSGPTIIFLHGANLDSRGWGPLPAALVSTHRVVLTDLRSHGHSPDATGPFSFVDDALEVLDAVGGERATVVGHSLGAQVAVDLAVSHPGRVNGLILMGPAVGGFQLSKPPVGFDKMMEALKRGDIPGAGVILAGMPVMTLYRDTAGQAEVRTIVTENARLFRASPSWVRRLEPPAAGRLAELRIPVLVLMGERDPTGSNETGQFLLERVAGAVADTFAGCGHLVPLDCGPETVRAVELFLGRI